MHPVHDGTVLAVLHLNGYKIANRTVLDRSRNKINGVVAGSHPAPQWLDVQEAPAHCVRGIGIRDWAGTDTGLGPEVANWVWPGWPVTPSGARGAPEQQDQRGP